jgi:large subunit ribosomal protein L17
MNKKVFGRKLSRSRPAREALFASLAQALIGNGKIVTTKAKAKAVQGSIEKMVTLARTGGVASERKVLSKLDNDRKAVNILFQKIAKAFSVRKSGFTRIISLPPRVGDNARMVRLEWTEKVEMESPLKSKENLQEKNKKAKPKKTSVKPKS